MTIYDQSAPKFPAANVRRDRWGRYLLPHPDTGTVQPWTRVTTVSGTLADRYGLERWAMRNVALGIGARRDLYAQAAAATPDDRDTLDEIVDQAQAAAQSKAGANMGSALHRLTERLDEGDLDPADIDDPTLRTDVEAYERAMTRAQIGVIHGWTEQIVLNADLGIAGTIDRLTTHPNWGLPRIGDLKTGKDVERYGMVEIPLQLALYAHATHTYDPVTDTTKVMPPIDRVTAIVMHLPAGQADCVIYEVDIAAGWDAVQTALKVREWRTRHDLATRIDTPNPPQPEGPDPRRGEWIKGWIRSQGEQGRIDQLAALWPQDVPTPKQGGWTDSNIDQIAQICAWLDAKSGVEFYPPDPTITPRRGKVK